MKPKLKIYLMALMSSVLLLSSCGASQTAAQKLEIANKVAEKVDKMKFTFKANYAYPTSYKSIYLSSFYEAKVSTDTVYAYLPYYGRAYTAPMNPSDGGIKINSTDFDYEVTKGKKKGNWILDINVKEKGDNISLTFDIWDNGEARLRVIDSKRQPISFLGEIVLDDDK